MADFQQRTLALEWIEGEHTRQVNLPEVGALRLGRDPGSDVVFDDLSVSRRHAEVLCGPGGPILRHVSRNSPTWLNGKLIVGDASIGAGDEIRLSTIQLHVREIEAQ